MKYILFEHPSDPIPTVRIFDDITSHNEVRAEVQSGKPGLSVLSAGKIWIKGDEITCVHQSVSLGISFDEEMGACAAATIKNLLKDR